MLLGPKRGLQVSSVVHQKLFWTILFFTREAQKQQFSTEPHISSIETSKLHWCNKKQAFCGLRVLSFRLEPTRERLPSPACPCRRALSNSNQDTGLVSCDCALTGRKNKYYILLTRVSHLLLATALARSCGTCAETSSLGK